MTNPSKLKLPKGYLSVSQIGKYGRCPRQYKYSIDNPAAFVPSIELIFGKAVHAGIEAVHEIQALGPTLDKCDAALHYATGVRMFFDGEDKVTPEEEAIMVEAAYPIFSAWWDVFASRITRVIATEEWFSREFAGIPMKGAIDLVCEIDGVPHVIDYKTTGRAKGQAWTKENLQLWVYSGIKQITHTGICFLVRPTVKMANWMKKLDSQSAADICKPFFHTVTPEQAAHAQEIVKDTAAAISLGAFPRCTPGDWWCSEKYCDYHETCRGSKGANNEEVQG